MEVIGYPKYTIYEDGRIWSKGRPDLTGYGGWGCLDTPKWMKQHPNEEGYHKVGLTNDETCKKFSVHRLVALHYIPNPMNYPEVDHKDRNPSNNHYTNLRWCSGAMNSKNKGMYKNNKTGHKSIIKRPSGSYIFTNAYNKISYRSSTCKTLSEVLWFKIVFLMRIKYGYYD